MIIFKFNFTNPKNLKVNVESRQNNDTNYKFYLRSPSIKLKDVRKILPLLSTLSALSLSPWTFTFSFSVRTHNLWVRTLNVA